MRGVRAVFAVCLLSLVTLPAVAEIAAIHADKLPQETAILAAYDDLLQLEPYVRSWTPQWSYPVERKDVVARMNKDLSFLQIAAKQHPDNVELLLLAGLVARYGYNLDIDGTYDASIALLAQAEKLAPSDIRAGWFRATLHCQTTETAAGAREFLQIEAVHAPDTLLVGFWNDYLTCTTAANLPAHTLRAMNYLVAKRGTDPSAYKTILNIAKERQLTLEPTKKYEPKDFWEGNKIGNEMLVMATHCGVSLRVKAGWEIDGIKGESGQCSIYLNATGYQGTVRTLRPGLVLVAHQAKPGETLAGYAKQFERKWKFEAYTEPACARFGCIAFKGVQTGMYQQDGDGRGRFVAFERQEPEFPGLALETPLESPKPDQKEGVQYFRPAKHLLRMPGAFFYVVLLDTASSIEEPALKDFTFFMEHLVVE